MIRNSIDPQPMAATLPRIIKLKSKYINILLVEKTTHIHVLFLRSLLNLLLLGLSLGNRGRVSLYWSRLCRGHSLGQLLELVVGRETNGHQVLEGALDHMWDGDLVGEIGSEREGGKGLGCGPDGLKNTGGVDLNDILWDDVFILVDDFEAHGILEGNYSQFLTHGSLGLIDHISFLDQEEVLDDLERTLDCLDLDSEILEFVDFSWVHVGVHASEPDVARSLDSGLGWHLDDLSLDLLLEVDIVDLSEDETDLSKDEIRELGQVWLGLILVVVFLVSLVNSSVSAENSNGKESQIVFSNHDFSTIGLDILSSILYLLGRDVDNINNDDLAISREILKELIDYFSLMVIEGSSVHWFIKN